MHLKSRSTFFSLYWQKEKLQHLQSIQSLLNNNASASGVFDKALNKYSWNGLDKKERFNNLPKLETCMSFISNPFMQLDIWCISEKLSDAFNLNTSEVEMEFVKWHSSQSPSGGPLWNLVDLENLKKNLHCSHESFFLF